MMYTGTTAEQDNRFSDKEKKLLKQMKFGDALTRRVDMSKVKLDTIKPWIAQKITEVLGIEDDVVVHFVFNQLEAKYPDPKKMQINLTGFLNGKNARLFMTELWDLLLSAQDSVTGIPEQFVEKKKEEIKKRMEEQEKIQDIAKKMEKSKERESKEKERRRDRSRDRKRSRSRDRHRDRDKDRRDKDKRDRENSKRSSTKSPSRGDKHSSKKESDSEQNLDNGKDRSRSHSPDESNNKGESLPASGLQNKFHMGGGDTGDKVQSKESRSRSRSRSHSRSSSQSSAASSRSGKDRSPRKDSASDKKDRRQSRSSSSSSSSSQERKKKSSNHNIGSRSRSRSRSAPVGSPKLRRSHSNSSASSDDSGGEGALPVHIGMCNQVITSIGNAVAVCRRYCTLSSTDSCCFHNKEFISAKIGETSVLKCVACMDSWISTLQWLCSCIICEYIIVNIGSHRIKEVAVQVGVLKYKAADIHAVLFYPSTKHRS